MCPRILPGGLLSLQRTVSLVLNPPSSPTPRAVRSLPSFRSVWGSLLQKAFPRLRDAALNPVHRLALFLTLNYSTDSSCLHSRPLARWRVVPAEQPLSVCLWQENGGAGSVQRAGGPFHVLPSTRGGGGARWKGSISVPVGVWLSELFDSVFCEARP